MIILSTTTHPPPLCLPATRLPPSPGRHTDGSLFRQNTAVSTVLDCGPCFSKLPGINLQQMPLSDRNWKGIRQETGVRTARSTCKGPHCQFERATQVSSLSLSIWILAHDRFTGLCSHSFQIPAVRGFFITLL